MDMPREAASSLLALGRGGGVGLLAREKSGRAAATVRKRNAPLAPLARRGDKGGISGQLLRCGRIPGAGPTAADVPQSAQRDWRGGRRPRGSIERTSAARWFSEPWRASRATGRGLEASRRRAAAFVASRRRRVLTAIGRGPVMRPSRPRGGRSPRGRGAARPARGRRHRRRAGGRGEAASPPFEFIPPLAGGHECPRAVDAAPAYGQGRPWVGARTESTYPQVVSCARI